MASAVSFCSNVNVRQFSKTTLIPAFVRPSRLSQKLRERNVQASPFWTMNMFVSSPRMLSICYGGFDLSMTEDGSSPHMWGRCTNDSNDHI